ncbi:type VI secretion system Vgr family protein [Jannaschia pohangensis]|uniref:Type VI secretion system secreted protein VgrG n=1 Tax=Jannaschia pohangensis TaxID=390807 RepID=A0A1I3TJ75_9RHOB|nr:type VI secretion system tip protein TssI/VgrG [Jannaschia pohangensis]SFJ70563.1 type VI secretion system secreted protein VgrG [Jannaschia pohangensis]
MNATFKQADRRGRLKTALGTDKLVLLRMDGTEELSGGFEWRVEALSDDPAVDLNSLLGTHSTVEIDMAGGTRSFDGVVAEATRGGTTENGNRYDLVLRPWLHVAGLRRNQRIFHDMTVVQIIKEVLSDYASLGSPHLTVQLTEEYPQLEYTVQYGESDATFAMRLMERFGISWRYRHTGGNHTLILSDSADTHPDVDGSSRPYVGIEAHHHADQEHFREWRGGARMTTGTVRLTEYNFKMPRAAQEVDRQGDDTYAHGHIESFDWPGDYLDQGAGKTVVARRLQAEGGQSLRCVAKGDVVSLSAGMGMTLSGEELEGMTGKRFICLKAEHRFRAMAYGSGDAQSDERAYDGTYVLLPDTAPFRPERRTPRPIIQGPQTAVVVGEGEVDCDEFGRILVRYHWDLAAEWSMRCRVSQNWAGKGWGGMVIPRIGMEVIVEHLEGDPDKPIVTGCVYNGANIPPADLPANKSRSVFKTNSHQGEGFNELTFEDQSGEEFIYLHAQKNLDMHVRNSSKRRVDFDDNVSVGNASNLDVAANRTETIEGKLDVKVTGAIAEKTEADRGADVAGNYAIRTGGDLTIKAAGEIVLDASKITLVSGGAALTVQGGAVNVSPMLNVGSASPGAAAIPAIPAVLQAAAGEGSPFVSHCPLKDGA